MSGLGPERPRVPRVITNRFSAGGVTAGSVHGNSVAKQYLSGALVADEWKEIFSATGGPGVIDFCSAYAQDATARIISLRVVIDSEEKFNQPSGNVGAANAGLRAIGGATGTVSYPILQPMTWNSSCVVSVKSSLTETDKVAVDIHAYTTK